jgi:hypothetical protein
LDEQHVLKRAGRCHKDLLNGNMLCLILRNTRCNFLLIGLPDHRVCWHDNARLILSLICPPGAVMPDNLPGSIIIINRFTKVTDCAIRRLGMVIAGDFYQDAVCRLSFLKDTRHDTSNGFGLRKHFHFNFFIPTFQRPCLPIGVRKIRIGNLG